MCLSVELLDDRGGLEAHPIVNCAAPLRDQFAVSARGELSLECQVLRESASVTTTRSEVIAAFAVVASRPVWWRR